MQESSVLVDTSWGLAPGLVDVIWEDATQTLSPPAAKRMDDEWESCLAEARAEQKMLFDGPITRLLQARATGHGENQRVVLTLAPGSYKAFVVTRLRDRNWFESHAPAAITQALGNSVFLTQGGQTLLGIRSNNVSCYAGRAHLIGGVLDQLGTPEFPATVEGLINHLLLELREEAHVTPADLEAREPLRHGGAAWPRLLGVFYDNVLGQPEAVWQWETRTPLEEISQRLDPAEHTGHLLLRKGMATPGTLQRLTPLARESFRAWSRQSTI